MIVQFSGADDGDDDDGGDDDDVHDVHDCFRYTHHNRFDSQRYP